jgi:hypothetical protein
MPLCVSKTTKLFVLPNVYHIDCKVTLKDSLVVNVLAIQYHPSCDVKQRALDGCAQAPTCHSSRTRLSITIERAGRIFDDVGAFAMGGIEWPVPSAKL